LEGFRSLFAHLPVRVVQRERCQPVCVVGRVESFHRLFAHVPAGVVEGDTDQRLDRAAAANRLEGRHRCCPHVRVLVVQRPDQRLDNAGVTGRLEGFHRLFAHLPVLTVQRVD